MATKHLLKVIPFVVGVALSSTSMAALITFNPINASWEDIVPSGVTTVFGQDTDNPKIRWGTPASSYGKSGYDFLAAPAPLNVPVPPNSVSAEFNLGTFTHINRPITGDSLDTVTLALSTDVYVDSVLIGTKSFDFKFTHLETTNSANPCADGGANGSGVNSNGCADRITTNWLNTSDSFSIGGVDYTLNILGFQIGEQSVNQFWTRENASNIATLKAQIASVESVQAVPEPATLLLLGAGLTGLAGFRRRRQAV